MLLTCDKYFVVSLFIYFFCTASSCLSEAAFKCQDCWRAEDSESTKAPYCDRPLSYYTDSVASYVDLPEDWILNSFGVKTKKVFSLIVDTVGLLNGGNVLDLIYNIGSPERHLVGKTILHEAVQNRYHVLYVYVSQMGEFFPAKSELFHIDSLQILTTKSRLGGQMSMYSTSHWTWNFDHGCPCTLNIGFSIKELFAQDIKREFKISSIGSLVFDSMYFWSYVELPGDHYRWPTGGKVWIKLAINGCELIVVDKGYDSTDIASH
ncbi:MAG TPA: hypothetical protein VHP63_02945 [candidate division Zixibacteria bacterium]|nr:hypothetical protein [candidate division Zixibacteria bacterium]